MSPEASFIISIANEMSNLRRRSLDLLYQPLLLPNAYALINLLWRIGNIKRNSLTQRPVAALLKFLSIDIRAFHQALLRLEGAGLVRVLYHRDGDQELYVYQLCLPQTPARFYHDDLLSLYLLEMVGSEQYRRLYKDLICKPPTFGQGFRDVTKNFLEVFTVDHDELLKPLKILKGDDNKSEQHVRAVNNHGFDFRMLLNIIRNSFVDEDEVKRNRRLILAEHAVYGINESQMANYLQRAASVDNNRIDFQRFKIIIANAFHSEHHRLLDRQRTTSVRSQPSPVSMSKQKRNLVRVAYDYSPADFLEQLRSQVHPGEAVTDREIVIIRHLLDYKAFKDNRAVINIMLYYVTVNRGMLFLKANFLDAMVNTWTAEQVNTPQDAIAALNHYQEKKRHRMKRFSRHRGGHYRSYRHSPVQEKLPKWAKKGYQQKLHRTSPAFQRKIRRRLKKLGEDAKSQRND